MFVLPTFGLGVIASPTVPPGTFDTATLNGQTNLDNTNVLTFTVQPSRDIDAGDSITLAGLTGSQTADNGSLTLSGAGASVFGSAGSWTQSTGTLVLTVDTGQTLSTGSDTVITFNLTNPATLSSGVSGITLDGPAGFTQASISGTFLSAVDIFNVTTRDTEANILASTLSLLAGQAGIAFGTDTGYYYIYDGSAWYIFNNDATDPVIITATNTEATILASTPTAYTIEQATDTDDLYVYDGSAWYIFNNDS
jgi:hypothetical protein